MSGRAYFKLPIATVYAETRGFSIREVGAYMLLMIRQAQDGPLPDDDAKLARLAEIRPAEWKKCAAAIRRVFLPTDDGRLALPWLEVRWEHGPYRDVNATDWKRLRARVFERDDYRCQYCDKEGVSLRCDHVIAAGRGGRSVMGNLVASCKECNSAKGRKPLEVFLADQPERLQRIMARLAAGGHA